MRARGAAPPDQQAQMTRASLASPDSRGQTTETTRGGGRAAKSLALPRLGHSPRPPSLRAQPLVAARAAPASGTALAYPFARLVLEAVAEMTVLLRAEGRPGPLQAERPRRGANLHRPNSFGGLGLGGQFGLDNRLVLAGCYHWLWRWGDHLCGSWPTRCCCFWALLGSRYCCRVLWRSLMLALFHRLTLEFEPNKHAFAEVANRFRAELSTGTRAAADLHHPNLHHLRLRQLSVSNGQGRGKGPRQA